MSVPHPAGGCTIAEAVVHLERPCCPLLPGARLPAFRVGLRSYHDLCIPLNVLWRFITARCLFASEKSYVSGGRLLQNAALCYRYSIQLVLRADSLVVWSVLEVSFIFQLH